MDVKDSIAGTLNGTFCKKVRSGVYVDLANPTPDVIKLDDISFALHNQCRYTGNVLFFSVAEHSIMAAEVASQDGCTQEQVKAVLLHDAHEAYLGDPSSPLKHYLRSKGVTILDELCSEWDKAIGERFGVDLSAHHDVIKYYDLIALKAEKERFWPWDEEEWACLGSTPSKSVNWRMLPPDSDWFKTIAGFLGIR